MLIVGLVILLLGAALVLAGLFSTSISTKGDLEILSIDVTPATLFLIGVIATFAILIGLWLMKRGARTQWRQRKEQKQERKQYEELGEKLKRTDEDRHDDERD